jgi:hypothetical protein
LYVNNLSFDPHDPLYDVPLLPGVQWGVQVFTTRNCYGLAPENVHRTETGKQIRLMCNQLSWGGQQQRSEGKVEVQLSIEDGGFVWAIQAWLPEPIKAIKLMIWGLPEAALKEGWWQPSSDQKDAFHPTDALPLLWRYPWPEWLTTWACAGNAPEAVCLSIRDSEVRAKRLYVYHPPYAPGEVVELVCEEDASRWSGHFATPPMYLRLCHTLKEIDDDFAAHQAFVESAFQLQPWETRPDVPEWLRNVRLVLNLHGQHWTGYVFNTFERMGEALRFVTEHIPGEQILVYLPGWEGRYYFAYPFYQPGEAMGGPVAFKRLVQTAHELGTKVMPMFGMHGANTQLYHQWRQAAFSSRTSGYVKFVNYPDWDNDRFGEDDQVFLNPGEPTFRQHLFEQVCTVIEDYQVDGIFLDTSACWFNDPRYNLIEGYRLLVDAFHRRFPEILIAGEGWYDALLRFFPVNQSWLGVERNYRYPQLLTRYARALGHLADGTPGSGSTGVHEGGFRPAPPQKPTPGHIPALGIVDDTLSRHRDAVIQICRTAASNYAG